MEKFKVVYRYLDSGEPEKELIAVFESDDVSVLKCICKEQFSGRFELVRIELIL